MGWKFCSYKTCVEPRLGEQPADGHQGWRGPAEWKGARAHLANFGRAWPLAHLDRLRLQASDHAHKSQPAHWLEQASTDGRQEDREASLWDYMQCTGISVASATCLRTLKGLCHGFSKAAFAGRSSRQVCWRRPVPLRQGGWVKEASEEKNRLAGQQWVCPQQVGKAMQLSTRQPWPRHCGYTIKSSSSLRSKAAAVYPKQLCEEILLGLEDSMVADYVLYNARNHEEAFPVEAEISAEEQPSEASNKEFKELMDMLDEPAKPGEAEAPPVPAPATPSNVLRRRPRVQEVKKGAWQNITEAAVLEKFCDELWLGH